jgi:hypothetical protein
LKQLWKTSPPLTATGLVMIPLLAAVSLQTHARGWW